MESPEKNMLNSRETSESQELTEIGEIKKIWNGANKELFESAVAEAESVEDILAAMKVCGVRGIGVRGPTKFIMHEDGSADEVFGLDNYVRAFADAVKAKDNNALYGLSDVGIPESVKNRIRTIYEKAQ